MSHVSPSTVGPGVQHEAAAASGPVDGVARSTWPRRSRPWWRDVLLRRMLACADVTAALLASVSLMNAADGQVAQLAWSLAYIPAWIVIAKLLGLYDRDARRLRHLTVDEIPQLVLWGLIGTSTLMLFLELTPAGSSAAYTGVVAGVVAVVSVFVLRASARWLWRATTPPERTVVIGSAENATALRRKLELFPDVHLSIVAEHKDLGIDDIPDDLDWLGAVDRIVVAPSSCDHSEIRPLLEIAHAAGVKLSVIPACSAAFSTTVQLHYLAELPLLEYKTSDLSRSTLFLKRVVDVAVSAAALVVLVPLCAVIAFAIKLDSPGPVLFAQIRAGVGGRPFRMLKFRSMVENAEELLEGLVSFDTLDEPVFKLRDDPRVTRVGRVLRRWSLDELPQLWNVLAGDMSLVGPRPEQLDLVQRYSHEQRFRLGVKPGMTGPMQVYGRGRLTLAERLAVERDYIENVSLGRDLHILGMTLAVVFGRRGAY